jgi:hypothetical protein
LKAVLGVTAGILLIAGYLFWVHQGETHYAAVGDCVSSPTRGELVQVSCGSAGAMKVLAKFSGDDSNQCDGVAGTTKAFVEYPTSATAFVLCVGAVS